MVHISHILVEHVIAGVKRCRIVHEVFRNTTAHLLISSWRLRVAYTTSAPRCDTQSESELCGPFIPDNVY